MEEVMLFVDARSAPRKNLELTPKSINLERLPAESSSLDVTKKKTIVVRRPLGRTLVVRHKQSDPGRKWIHARLRVVSRCLASK